VGLLKPCIEASCGELVDSGSRCEAHTIKRTRVQASAHQRGYTSKWRSISAAARRKQPWCLDCGTTEGLTGDHIIPISEAPELALEALNVAVRCRRHNSQRSNQCTPEERPGVRDAIAARKARRARFVE
jgi:5-methylcytosine-specific restriction protein A